MIRRWSNTNTVFDSSQYGRGGFVYCPVYVDGFRWLSVSSLTFQNDQMPPMHIALIRSSQSMGSHWRWMLAPARQLLHLRLTATRTGRDRLRRESSCKNPRNSKTPETKRRRTRRASAKALAAPAGAPAWWKGSLARFAGERGECCRASAAVERDGAPKRRDRTSSRAVARLAVLSLGESEGR